MQIDGTLPINHTYSLGRPSGILLAAGLPDLPIELQASMLQMKSSVYYIKAHPFRLEALKNLPRSLHNPVMVFDSQTKAGSKVVLIDLKSGNVNFVVAIRLEYRKGSDRSGRVSVNSVRSLYPKDKVNDIFKWICSGLLRYAGKKKASLFLKELRSQGAQKSSKKSNAFRLKNFNRAANIIKNFVNPKKR
jgi:chemotaxis response regulator CheB